MKYLLTLLIYLFLPLCAVCEVLQGGVSYDVQTAQKEAFENIDNSFSVDLTAAHMADGDYDENMTALLTGNTELKDRILCKFSTGIYGVRYKNDPYRAYYYTMDGKLSYTDKKNSLKYPHNVTTYDLNGNLIGSALYVSKYEQFIFKRDKKLQTHWIGENGYDAAGVVKWTRAYYE